MLVLGWTIERTNDGESQGFHNPARRISQSGKVMDTLLLQLFFNHKNNINNKMELNIKIMGNIISKTALILNHVLNCFNLCNCFP